MKKKVTIICCIILILFNFICIPSFAEEGEATTTTSPEEFFEEINTQTGGIGTDTILQEITTGTTTIGEEVLNVKNNSGWDVVSSIIGRVVVTIVSVWNNILELVVEATGTTGIGHFTIYDLVTGRYEFFNMNFMTLAEGTDEEQLVEDVIQGSSSMADLVQNNKDKLEGKEEAKEKETLGDNIQKMVLKFYNILRNLSLGLSIFILIYIGIRMAISTITSDKVKYQKMFINWLASVVLLFFMHFIIIMFSYLNQFALDLVNNIAGKMGITNIEAGILEGQFTALAGSGSGFHYISLIITCAIFLYYQIKFLMAYIHRYCEIVFLITVSPLVTITYSIDKVSDNKAQAFKAWFKELSIKYSIQVIHAITYCVFIVIAGAIAQAVPIVAAVFFLALSRAEKIFRNIFEVKDTNFEKARVPILDKK